MMRVETWPEHYLSAQRQEPATVISDSPINMFFKLVLASLLFDASVVAAEKTTNVQLNEVLERECDDLSKYRLGSWDCTVGDRVLMILTDEWHNRMRIMTPAAKVTESENLLVLLEANFDRAMDAKYSVHSGQIISLFMHPLAELNLGMVPDALKQVKTLADNYGTTFSSSSLSFVGRTSSNKSSNVAKQQATTQDVVVEEPAAEQDPAHEVDASDNDESYDEVWEEEEVFEDEDAARIAD